MWQHKKNFQLVFFVFFVFFLFVLAIYWVGKNMYAEKSGLSESLAKEYIVQYLVKVKGVPIEAKVERAANRVELGAESKINIYLRNISSELVAIKLEKKLFPENEKMVTWNNSPEIHILAPSEKREIKFFYSLQSGNLNSKDGTLDFIFEISSAPAN